MSIYSTDKRGSLSLTKIDIQRERKKKERERERKRKLQFLALDVENVREDCRNR